MNNDVIANKSKHEIKTAILVDGGFYRKKAKVFPTKTPSEAAKELHSYCMDILNENKFEYRNLYRIFYYDCPPSELTVYHPFTNKSVNLKKKDEYTWMNEFLHELRKLRKVALRMGRMSDNDVKYQLKYETLKKLFNNKINLSDITEQDFLLQIKQKGVDMRIGVDISALAFKKQVQQIILISGDSDFVPASKQARREGIDFILDPMGSHVADDLFEHVDGLRSARPKYKYKKATKDIKDDAFTLPNVQ